MAKSQKENQGCYFTTALSLVPVILIFEWLWPNVIPFTLFEFWKWNVDWAGVLAISWPMFAWGIGFTALVALITRNHPDYNAQAEILFAQGFINSTIAGIFEEISFRWIIYYSQMVTYSILNFIFFGWLGFGLFEWFFLHITGPLANFFTLGYLAPYLFSPLGWIVGSAIITSNGSFRNGHLKNGFVNYVNSWFIGMYLFYIMFQHGLVAAIAVHFLYDFFIYAIIYYDALLERNVEKFEQFTEKNKNQ